MKLDRQNHPLKDSNLVGIGLILVIGAAVQWITLNRDSLWLDEIIAVTQAVQSFTDLIISSAWVDMHPPLYFIQLHYWMFVSTSDTWLRLNSEIWALIAIAALYLTTRKRFGEPVALTAAFILAALPSAIYFAQEVRMYSMLMALMVVSWHLNEKIVENPSTAPSNRALFLLGLSEFAIVFTHAIGFYMAFFIGLYSLYRLLPSRKAPVFRRWLWTQGIVAIIALPFVLKVLFISSASSSMSTPMELIGGLTRLILGRPHDGNILVHGGIVLLLGFICYLAFHRNRARPMVIFMVILPVVLTILVSITVKPMYKPRALTVVLPFLSLGLAAWFWDMARHRGAAQIRRIGVAGMTLGFILLVAAGLVELSRFHGHHDFRHVAERLSVEAGPGDTIYTGRGIGVFWGIAWYYAGTHWGKSNAVGNLVFSDKRKKIANLVGPQWSRRLGLLPRTNKIESKDVTLILGKDSAAEAYQGRRVWQVVYGGNPNPPVQQYGHCQVRHEEFKGLDLYLYVPADDPAAPPTGCQ